ncbi:hypothetical protein [Tolypothrix sp. NIES-4075]|uniref:hypothetical protein n=1 Tax=Tolypothrix sp. NIES-4075 TaxID=2005459 RepID=UPI00118087CB|nr:hypothetical protein [Tolypothrix sp. NIES-4075]
MGNGALGIGPDTCTGRVSRLEQCVRHRQCGLLPEGEALRQGVGPAWSICRHWAFTLSPSSNPIALCPKT